MSDSMADIRNNRKLRDEIESLRKQLEAKDDEVAELRQHVKLLRDAMEAAWQDGYYFCGAEGLSDAQKQFKAVFAATESKP